MKPKEELTNYKHEKFDSLRIFDMTYYLQLNGLVKIYNKKMYINMTIK